MRIKTEIPGAELAFRELLGQSKTGLAILTARPDLDLEIVRTPRSSNFNGAGNRRALHINAELLDKFRQLSPRSEKEAASMLVHEAIHAIHHFDDRVAFKTRNQSNSRHPTFKTTTEEEELTITGKVFNSDIPDDPLSENSAREEMGLSPRTDYGPPRRRD